LIFVQKLVSDQQRDVDILGHIFMKTS